MEVFYNEKIIKDGEFLKVSETQLEPKIKLNVNRNDLYTLVLYDPDAVKGTYIHWVKVNITNNDIKTGNIIIPYKGPAPPANSGKHRYIFNLFKQNRENKINPISEKVIELNNLKKILGVDELIYEIKFISENKNGGKIIRNIKKTQRKLNKNKRYKKTRKY